MYVLHTYIQMEEKEEDWEEKEEDSKVTDYSQCKSRVVEEGLLKAKCDE